MTAPLGSQPRSTTGYSSATDSGLNASPVDEVRLRIIPIAWSSTEPRLLRATRFEFGQDAMCNENTSHGHDNTVRPLSSKCGRPDRSDNCPVRHVTGRSSDGLNLGVVEEIFDGCSRRAYVLVGQYQSPSRRQIVAHGDTNAITRRFLAHGPPGPLELFTKSVHCLSPVVRQLAHTGTGTLPGRGVDVRAARHARQSTSCHLGSKSPRRAKG